MTIDTHQHFWHFDLIRDAWIVAEMSVIRHDFLPEHLLPILEKNGIDACIAVQADQSIEETLFLLRLSEQYPFVRGVVGWTDLCSPFIEEHLKDWKKYPKLLGFRHILQAENPDFLLKPEFLRGIQALSSHHFIYDILVYPQHLPNVVKMVAQFPEQTFVLDHIAKPLIKEGILENWATDIRELATFEHVYCKVSGILTEADWKSWTFEQIRPYLDIIFEAFGADRLMFGSDWPVCLLAGTYEDTKSIIEMYMKDYPEIERQKVFGTNAQRIYGIKQ